MPSKDLLAQDFCTFQVENQPKPPTIASAATIVPVHGLTVVSGVVAIANITPPLDGFHVLWFIPTGALPAFLLTGNVVNAGAVSTANVPFAAVYNPVTKKYHIMAKA
jgi:hypothetical protein